MNARTTTTATTTTAAESAEWEVTRCISRTLDGIRAGDPVAAERHARAALDAAKLYAAEGPTDKELHRMAAFARAARGHAQRKGTGFARTVLFLRGAGGHLIHAVSQRH